MLPVAHDDPLAVHVGIVIASLDHTIILRHHAMSQQGGNRVEKNKKIITSVLDNFETA